MKVAVITRHAITNYGSLLQAMATQKVIEKMGHTCEIIDYVRNDESYQQHEKTLLKRKPNWNNNPIKRMLYLALRQPESILAGRKFEKYRKKYLKMTKRFSNAEELKQETIDADVFVTGSDQVWGPVEDGTYDSSYCLSFVPKGKRKISYAASFGRTELTKEKEEYFHKWLSEYDAIAVREDSAVGVIKQMGLEAEQVIDPTLLLSATEWKKYMAQGIAEKYILVYQLHNNPKLGKYAKKLAKEKGLPLIRISASFHQITRPGKFVWCPTIGEFLAYINNAECMITDSFHGTAFALNLNTSFVEVLPNNNTGTRNVSILNLTGLSDRILRDINDVSLAEAPINFETVNQILSEKRKEAIQLLRNMLKD